MGTAQHRPQDGHLEGPSPHGCLPVTTGLWRGPLVVPQGGGPEVAACCLLSVPSQAPPCSLSISVGVRVKTPEQEPGSVTAGQASQAPFWADRGPIQWSEHRLRGQTALAPVPALPVQLSDLLEDSNPAAYLRLFLHKGIVAPAITLAGQWLLPKSSPRPPCHSLKSPHPPALPGDLLWTLP